MYSYRIHVAVVNIYNNTVTLLYYSYLCYISILYSYNPYQGEYALDVAVILLYIMSSI